ncbi:MAG: PPC domain-containing protein [Gemmataceae bacterium]
MTRALALLLLLFALVPASGQKKKADGGMPAVLMALPFGVSAGKTVKVELRGLKLEGATAVKASRGAVKLLAKGKVGVPAMQEATKVGDSRVEVEVTAPADGDALELIVVTADGDSKPHRLLIDRTALVTEKEPDDGFKQAQPVKAGDTVAGVIERSQDVDVFRFEAKAGQTVMVEVFAARHGGALDAFLAVHDADGQLIDSCDDIKGSSDARVEFKAPRAGAYFAVVSDANDQGGATHAYRLTVSPH